MTSWPPPTCYIKSGSLLAASSGVAFPRQAWATAPRSAEFDFLLAESQRLVGSENVCLLTSPTIKSRLCGRQIEWIQKHLPYGMGGGNPDRPTQGVLCVHRLPADR